MNSSLMSELVEFAHDKKELVELCKNNEQQTKNSLVEPYIRLLGFDTSDARAVRVEYQTATVRAADRVDYALMVEERPIVFVEAKSLAPQRCLRYIANEQATEKLHVGLCQRQVWSSHGWT